MSRTLFVELCFLQWATLMRDLTVASDKYIQDEFVIITVLKYKFKRQSTFRLSCSKEKPCSFEALLATAHVHHFTVTFSSVCVCVCVFFFFFFFGVRPDVCLCKIPVCMSGSW